jgi:hypothetical protein
MPPVGHSSIVGHVSTPLGRRALVKAGLILFQMGRLV